MHVTLCIENTEDLNYCKQQLQRLAEQNQIRMTLDARMREQEIIFRIGDLLETDLFYLGISEPGLDGMKLAKILRNEGVMADIVFFTKDTRRFPEAFDVDALHFLVPGRINNAKFAEVFQKAVRRTMNRKKDTIRFSCAGEFRRIVISDIQYFEVNRRIITVHYQNTFFEFYSTLSKLEEILKGHGFVRINRSMLVAKEYISKATKDGVTLYSGRMLSVSRSYAENLNRMIKAEVMG